MIRQVVSLTNQNQITLPVSMVKKLGKDRPKNMVVYMTGNKFVIKPIPNIRLLAGILKSDIKLSEKQLREARNQFEKTWAREM